MGRKLTHDDVDRLNASLHGVRNEMDAICRSICDVDGEEAAGIWTMLRDISISIGTASHWTYKLRPTEQDRSVRNLKDVTEFLYRFVYKYNCRPLMSHPILKDGVALATDGRVAVRIPCECKEDKAKESVNKFGDRVNVLFSEDVQNSEFGYFISNLHDICRKCRDGKQKAIRLRGCKITLGNVFSDSDAMLLDYDEEVHLTSLVLLPEYGLFRADHLMNICDMFMRFGNGGDTMTYMRTGTDGSILRLRYGDLDAVVMQVMSFNMARENYGSFHVLNARTGKRVTDEEIEAYFLNEGKTAK